MTCLHPLHPQARLKAKPSGQPDTGLWLYGPEIFKIDCRRHNLRADTASTISVDHTRTLSKELRDADTMVLRLGTGHGSDDARGQTAFALVRHDRAHLRYFCGRKRLVRTVANHAFQLACV